MPKQYVLRSKVDEGKAHHLMVLATKQPPNSSTFKLTESLNPPLILRTWQGEEDVELPENGGKNASSSSASASMSLSQKMQQERASQLEQIGGVSSGRRLKSFHKKTHVIHAKAYDDGIRKKLDGIYQRSLVKGADSKASTRNGQGNNDINKKSNSKHGSSSSLQWKLEDRDGTAFIGRKENALSGDDSTYVFFVMQGDQVSVIPCRDWIKFQPKLNYTTLTMEEAEVEMKRSSGDRWMMKSRAKKPDQLGDDSYMVDVKDESAKVSSLQQRLFMPKGKEVTGETVVIGQRDRRMQRRDEDEMEYDDVFEDDEEGGFDGLFNRDDDDAANPAVTMTRTQAEAFREQQSRLRGLYLKRDYDEDEDDGAGISNARSSRSADLVSPNININNNNILINNERMMMRKSLRKGARGTAYRNGSREDLLSHDDKDNDDDDLEDEDDDEDMEDPYANVLEGETLLSASAFVVPPPLPLPVPSTIAQFQQSTSSLAQRQSNIGNGSRNSSPTPPPNVTGSKLKGSGGASSSSSNLTPSIKKIKLSSGQSRPASTATGIKNVSATGVTNSASQPASLSSSPSSSMANNAAALILSESDIIPLLKQGPITTRQLLVKLKRKIKERPENQKLLMTILNKIATLKPGLDGGKVVELKPEYQ